MKKNAMVFFFVVFLSLVVLSATSAEVQIDLKSFSVEELVILRDSINQELLNRDFEEKEVTVPPGQYTIGEDIPEGTYTISKTGTMPAMIVTYTSNGELSLSYNVSSSSPVGKIKLEQNQTIEISFDSVVFSPYKVLGF